MFYLKLVTIILVTTFSSSAFAWTWTCNPKESNAVAVIPPPKINLMVDKSGSMGSGGGIFASTCKVCQGAGGEQYAVGSYSECIGSGAWDPVARTVILGRYSVSQYPRYDFSIPVPAAAGNNVFVTISAQGDYGSSNEYASVYIGGVYRGRMDGVGSDCNAAESQTFTVDRSTLPPGNISVSVRASYAVSTHCSSNRNKTVATVSPTEAIGVAYIGSQTNSGICGVTKWDIAKSALDSLTNYSDSTSPELAHFGLGLFSGNSSNNVVTCGSQNNDAIMNQLDANGPGGGTPTSVAIATSVAGACFANSGTEPTATVLVNDGSPNSKTNTMIAACAHRNTAILYIVGLGNGTDEDYNNILAAAGGSGTCENDVDPCINPNDWGSLRNKCEGSIQTSNQSQLTAAIGGISADLGCAFRINFSGTVRESVPEDGSSKY